MTGYIYPIPYTAARLSRSDCANPGLLFERYVGYRPGWSLKAEGGDNPKRDALDEVIRANGRLHGPQWRALRDGLLARWQQMVTAAGASIADKTLFKASPVWRFITGIGRNSPLEVGFTFDRLYGLPLLPGSSLKGLTRAYVLWTWADELDVPLLRAGEVKARHKARPRQLTPLEQLEDALITADDDRRAQKLAALRQDAAIPGNATLHAFPEDEFAARSLLFRQVFGSTEGQGGTLFFDAIPEKVTLEIDVMTPHYPDYYKPGGNDWPTDWQDPNPVPFLTVGQDSVFYFAVAGAQQEKVAEWLRSALDFPGAGAKTAAGYGVWQPAFFAVASEWRQAVIREVNPTKRRGVLEDVETGERLRFSLDDVEPRDITPGKKWTCEYRLEQADEHKIVRVRNARRP
ncbi:MAG: type III-B CRISPR module RAMP protein Cmr6 [Anaerolineae bacterium]|nr:type III-B CRISPR module RAMP protein Cmr6 [Anaerolineae bacterium]